MPATPGPVMGNHEFNAIGYLTPQRDNPSAFLRSRSPKNEAQHIEFLRQVGPGSALHCELVEWFKSLPPMLDLEHIRVVPCLVAPALCRRSGCTMARHRRRNGGRLPA